MIQLSPAHFRKSTPIILIGAILVVCSTAQADTMHVSANIAPLRIITVDDKHLIVKILSNSPAAVEPIVYQQARSNARIAYDAKIRNQYLLLSKSINFSKPGVVYRKNTVESSWLKFLFWK